MKSRIARVIAASTALLAGQAALAGTPPYFVPLTQSAPVSTPNSAEEFTSPWTAPAGITQWNLTSLSKVEADIAQSIVRVPGLGSSASMFDMIAFDDTGNYLFIPHETFVGAGATRYDIANDEAVVLFRGDAGGLAGDWSKDWGAFDPSTWTPNRTLLLAEEWSGEGRVIEVLNPLAAAGDIQIRELGAIINVSHEGLRFSNNERTLYFVDEDNSGSIYKFVMKKKGDYTRGQTFVLKIDGFHGEAGEVWNSPANSVEARTGRATWVPVTDKDGNALTSIDPFVNAGGAGARAGRFAVDELGATPYGRPEDIAIGQLERGGEVLYFAATSENAVYSVRMIGAQHAMVKLYASESATPKNLGFAATTGVLNSPDNLDIDSRGNLYIVEDAPNTSSTGGDVWFGRDVDGDGVAESLDHFLSIRVDGSEATGLIFNPANRNQFAVSVQHPDSTDLDLVEAGFGDAVWMFDISGAVAP